MPTSDIIEESVECAYKVIAAYSSEEVLHESAWAQKAILACLISDLMHFCDSRNFAFDDILDQANTWHGGDAAR